LGKQSQHLLFVWESQCVSSQERSKYC